jgi:hypothetical protein
VTTTAYDSRPATRDHIARVRALLAAAIENLAIRADEHDASKLVDPELAIFDEYTTKLQYSTYGSAEYEEFLAAMGEGLRHHYEHNSHHPEHYADGIAGMSLLDLIEMLCDWKAATERHEDGDLALSIAHNQQRFGYSDELHAILRNTAVELGLLP